MRKSIVLILAVSVIMITACASAPNPERSPEVTAEIPELFNPIDEKLVVPIKVSHPVPIDNWTIQIQPGRQGGQGGQRPEGEQGQRVRERPEGEQGQRQAGEGQGQRRGRGPFFEQSGKGRLPSRWEWNGKSTRETGEMVQSATDYRFILTVNDKFGNAGTYEGIIGVDVLVIQDGDDLRIIVPSIVFPPNSANLNAVSEDEQRSNRRVLRLIANALTKYDDYAITVEGHSNPITPPGTPERTAEEKADEALSQQRAQAVVSFLVDNNDINQGRLTSIGMSCTKPVAEYDDEDENWKNRRVEFLLRK